MRIISDTEIAICDRFFHAVEVLAERKVIHGLQTFTKKHGINYGNMCTLKNNRNRYALKTEYLSFIAQDYGVSCEWLLLGNGEMFVSGSPALMGKTVKKFNRMYAVKDGKLVLKEEDAPADVP